MSLNSLPGLRSGFARLTGQTPKSYATWLCFVMVVAGCGGRENETANLSAAKVPADVVVKDTASRGPITVTIARLEKKQDNAITIRFTNRSADETFELLRPLDGSEWCWIMPYYRTTVTDTNGNAIKLASRCGNFGFPYYDTKWPDDYRLSIVPGQSIELGMTLPNDIRKTGLYDVFFEYVFEAADGAKTGGGAYPPGLWQGTIASATVRMHLVSR